MRKIIWSEEARQDYSTNIDYLLEEWSYNEAQEFVNNTDFIIKNLPSFPKMFPISNYKKVRKGIVCKQISILYRVYPNRIELLRFWNNYKDPRKLKI